MRESSVTVSESEPMATQREPMVTKSEPKGGKRDPKGSQREQTKAKRAPTGDQNALTNPPTLWSGVLNNFEAKGGGPPPKPPSALGALPGRIRKNNPFLPNGPSLDPFGQNGA